MTEPSIELSGAARVKWDALAPVVEARPRRKATDLDDLAAYCAAFGRWAAAEEWLSDPSRGAVLTIRDDKGNVKSHGVAPQVLLAERSAKEMARLAKALRL